MEGCKVSSLLVEKLFVFYTFLKSKMNRLGNADITFFLFDGSKVEAHKHELVEASTNSKTELFLAMAGK